MSKYALVLFVLVALMAGCAAHTDTVAQTGSRIQSKDLEVHFLGAGGFELQGALRLPKGAGKHPAILLLPGSGPTDRDGNQGPLQTNILKDIADNLETEGVASLRFDKRAVGSKYANRFPPQSKFEDFFDWDAFVADAEEAYRFMQSSDGIDPVHCGVLGHSEGGAIALAMASKARPQVLILVSTAGRDLGEVLVDQIEHGYSSQFEKPEVVKARGLETRRIVDSLRRSGKNPDKVAPELAPLFPPYLGKYFKGIFTFQPAEAAKAYKGHALIVQADKDIQISAQADMPRLLGGFPQGEAELYMVKNATHCLKKYLGPKDPGFSGPTDQAALDKIGVWAQAHLK